MPRYKRYIAANVLDEARARMRHIYDIHDSVVVSFSGGKDSLVVLHLAKEVHEERGLGPVNALFRDEELIHPQVADFVREIMLQEWVDLTWWCLPLASHKYVLGEMTDYVQWEPGREHMRPMPEWAVTLDQTGFEPDTVLSQLTADDLIASAYPGKVCILTGIRADESIIRFRSVVNKLNENYIAASGTRKATLGRPIFDWHENDVFRYFHDKGIRYCPVYDAQAWAGQALRVSSAINTQNAKNLPAIRRYDPDLYALVMDLHPEMSLQERYYRELDREGTVDRYAESWETIRAWVMQNVSGDQRRKALKELESTIRRAKRDPDAYPRNYVLKCLMRQAGKRTIQPLPENQRSQHARPD